MDIDVTEAKVELAGTSVAWCTVRFHEACVHCKIYVYDSKKLWVKMPAILHKSKKLPLFWFQKKSDSDIAQAIILKRVFELTGLDVDMANIELGKRKLLTLDPVLTNL